MKTTLDLPVDLVREMKIRAAHEGRKLKEVAAEVLRRGLAEPAAIPQPAGKRVSLPLIACQAPASPGEELTPDQIAELLAKEDANWSHDAARP